MSSESALSYSRFKIIANPAKVTGGPKEHKDDGKNGAQDADGKQFIVVFTTGADPDIVPFALDARSYSDPNAELVIAMPDTHITRTNRLALEKATKPARFLGIPAATKNSQLASPS